MNDAEGKRGGGGCGTCGGIAFFRHGEQLRVGLGAYGVLFDAPSAVVQHSFREIFWRV